MKSRLLFLSVLMMFSITSIYAQTSFSSAGIAIQGIARDNNNTALKDQTISLTFKLYYLDNTNNEELILETTDDVTTDAFGVFSHILNPGSANNIQISNNEAYLRIKNSDNIISDEKLKHVPYAISANNGVPTGSIMPYIGTTPPPGWVLCNGQNISSTTGSAPLISLLGSNNVPDLRGMFLRGAGSDSRTSTETVNLKATQEESLKSHLHPKGTLAVGGGTHRHWMNFYVDETDADGDGGSDDRYGDNNSEGVIQEETDSREGSGVADGTHEHTISGSTGNTGGSETRPVNYGVNYIIKL